MRYLSRQRPAAATGEEAARVVQLLHALTRGPGFVKQNIYRASAVEGGWVVAVENDSGTNPVKAPSMSPYELLVDAGGHVTQIRQRCYIYLGSPAIYDRTIRLVYEREMKLNGAINYPAALEKELTQAWEKEKEQLKSKSF
jgi:hypothetical protein